VDFAFDESVFRKIIVVLLIAIVIVGAVAVLRFSGILGGSEEVIPSAAIWNVTAVDIPIAEEDVAGLKTYAWTYHETHVEMTLYIPDDTYRQFAAASYGKADETPQQMADYIITDGDGGIVEILADRLLEISLTAGYGDTDTIGNVLAFASSLNYTTDNERGQIGTGPNYPVVTLATQDGDSADHAILAAAILKQMGYGVSLLYYPATYDRRTIIPGATALGIVTDGTTAGHLYRTVAETPAGRIVYYPENGTCTAALPAGADQAAGWYTGEAVQYNDSSSAPLGTVRYYPANLTFDAGTGVPDTRTIVVEDAVWQQPITVEAAWAVNTTDKGTDRAAYDGMVPYFVGGDGLWLGHVATRDDRLDADTAVAGVQPLDEAPPFLANESVATALHLPVSEASPSTPTWMEPAEEYYTDVWYPSGVVWTYDNAWHLYNNFLAMVNPGAENPDAYTLQGIANVSAPTAWRITYDVREMDKAHSKEDMTPYSDVRIAIYRIVDGAADLKRTLTWQTLYGAEQQKNGAAFGPGDYAVAVFVRNCAVDVTIEYHGKPLKTTYRGDI